MISHLKSDVQISKRKFGFCGIDLAKLAEDDVIALKVPRGASNIF
jgi:hypothetical protein